MALKRPKLMGTTSSSVTTQRLQFGNEVAPTGQEPVLVRWFGETVKGRFAEYERRWMREGYNCVVDDPREIADFYREFSTWKDMPGKGVCGLTMIKAQ